MARRKRDTSVAVERDRAQYGPLLARRYRLLTVAGNAYDAGDEDQAVVLASILRLLLSEGDRLINRVTSIRKMRFTDTAIHPTDDYAIGGLGYGLTSILATAVGPGHLRGGRIVAPLGREIVGSVVFRDWWSRDLVVYPTSGPAMTRQFVVEEMANTDGIHVDSRLNGRYEALTRDNHGFTMDGAEVTGNVAHAAVRQIAWETQHSLQIALPDLVGTDLPMKREDDHPDSLYFRITPIAEPGQPVLDGRPELIWPPV
ncbi:hypothetical protein QNA19_08780 [Rhodococcus fascians]|uniref:hypothetical protein n=1 Tax=Rhodococcoides fascians TaxID=1828 RepID=UPI0024BAE3C9|nr:hypothetical protein [Rhodococcus fascians]MDJ0426010.1 hypothetical protein [Rhodococcus fascians]